MKLYGIQCLRGLAALLVIFVHMHIWEIKNLPTTHVLPDIFKIGDIGVDIFFLLSGFIMAYVTPKGLNSFSEQKDFLYRRFTRIFPLYWLILFSVLSIRLVKPELVTKDVDILKSIFLLPQDHVLALQVGWTLIYELYFYLLVSFVFRFNQKFRLFIGLTLFACILLINYSLNVPDFNRNRYLQLIFSPFNLEFLFGLLLGLRINKLAVFNKLLSFSILVVALILVYLAYLYMPFVDSYPNNNSLYRVAYEGIPSALLLLAVLQIERGKFARFPQILISLGEWSYSIYLIHVPLLVGSYRLLAVFLPKVSPLVLWFSNALILAMIIIAGYIVNRFIEKPILAYMKKLGNRENKLSVS